MSNKLPNIGSDVYFLCFFFCFNRPCCKGYHKPHKLLSLYVPFFNHGGNKKEIPSYNQNAQRQEKAQQTEQKKM